MIASGRKRVFCPHCEEYICKSAYYQHKQLYYCDITEQWKKQEICLDFKFSLDVPSTSNGSDLNETTDHINTSDCPLNDSEESSSHDDIHSEPEEIEDGLCDEDINCEPQDINKEDRICDEDLLIDSEGEIEDDISNVVESNSNYHKVIRLLLLFLFMWQSIYRISNAAFTLLLTFFRKFFSLMSVYLGIPTLRELADIMPNTLYKAKKCLGLPQDAFKTYVVCPSCHKLYAFSECWKYENNKKISKYCTFTRHPNHSQARMRKACGEMLLSLAKTSSGTFHLVPFKVFCYKSVAESLEQILNKPNMLELCENWKNRKTGESHRVYTDIYDGRVWQSFLYDMHGLPFLAAPHNYLMILNCDWFQPYKHTQFSIGILYLVIGNLPRDLRYKKENILIVGIMPGPSEPSKDVNTYLEPLIIEMKKLWKGTFITVNNQPIEIRAAIFLPSM